MATTLAALAAVTWSCGPSREQEVLLTSGEVLTPEWREFRPTRPLRTAGPWSELFVELPELTLPRMGLPDVTADGQPVEIVAEVSGAGGVRLAFDKSYVVGFNTVVMLSLSTSSLKGSDHDYRFDVLLLRSTRPIRIGKVVWLSCDPSTRSDGICWPKALK